LALLWAASAYFWILPIWRPHGPYLWGHYRFTDIYIGLPVALITFCATLAALAPARLRRPLALRLTVMCVTFIVSMLAVDLIYSFVVVGAWRPNYWLDQAHINRRYSDADAELGFVRKPLIKWRGHVSGIEQLADYRTDEQGFRNPPGVRRADIVFIGDSFTEAASVEESETFAQRIAAETGVTVVNLGRGAYGPQQELIVLERYGLSYQPRVVVWQLFEGNDLGDVSNFAQWRSSPQPPTKPLLIRYFDNSLLRLPLERTWRSQSPNPRITLRYHDGTSQQMVIRYLYEPRQVEEAAFEFDETKKAIEAGYRLCQSRGIRLVIIHVPMMVRVMEPWIDFASAADRERALPGGSVNSPLDFANQLGAFCQQLGCPYLDLFTPLRNRAAADNRNLYIPTDEHLDTQGHEVVAQAVRQFLADIK
jgi:hypothetical protein